MVNYDEVIERNKRYLTNAQVNALVAASQEYNIQNAGNRAGALASAREQYDTGYRGLQNMGLAGAMSGAPTSGEVPRLQTQIQAPFDAYNNRLRQVENQRLNAMGGMMAEQTRQAQAAAAAQRAAAQQAAAQQAAIDQVRAAEDAIAIRISAAKQQTAADAATKAQIDGMKRTAQAKQPIVDAANKYQLDGLKKTAQTQQQLAQDQIALRAAAEVLGVKTVNQNAAAANAAQERGAALTAKLGGSTDTSTMNVYRDMTNQEKAEQTRLERAANEDTGRGAIEARKALTAFNKGLNEGFEKGEAEQQLKDAQKKVDAMDEARNTGAWDVPDDVYRQAVAQRDAAQLKAEDPLLYSFLVVANSNADEETKRLVGEKFINQKFDDDAEDAALKYKSAKETVSRMEAEQNKGKDGPSLRDVNDAIEVYYSAVKAYEDTAGNGAPSAASREPIDKANKMLNDLGFKSIHAAERYRDSITNTEEPEGLQQARDTLAAAELRYKDPDTYRAIRLLQYKDQLKQTNPEVVQWAEEKAADYQLQAMGIKTPGMATHDYRAEEADVKGLRKAYNNWKMSQGDAAEWNYEKELKEKYGVTPEEAEKRLNQFYTEKDNRLEYSYYKDGMVALLDHSGETPSRPVNTEETDPIYRKVNGLSNITMAATEYEGAESYNVANWMTQEQKDAYNAIYERDGIEAADQYFKDITPFLNIQRAMQDEAYYKQYADEHPLLADLRSVGASLLYNVPAAIDRLAHGAVSLFTDTYYDPNSDMSYRSGRADVIRSERSQNILSNMSRPEWVNNVLNFAYQTGMSMADSGVAMTFAYAGAPWMVDALFFSSAGNAAYKEARERGATQTQAMEIGILSGAAEAFFEHASIEHFMKLDYTGKGALVKNLLSQGFVEGSEEVSTEIANALTDAWIMKDNSKYSAAVKEYMSQGMPEEQAQNKAFMDQLADIGMAGLGGAVSGGLFALGGAVINSAQYSKEGKRLSQNAQAKDRIIQLAEIMGGDAQEALDAYNADKTNRNLGELSATVQNNMLDMFGKEVPDVSKASAMHQAEGAGNQMDLDTAVRDQIVDKATAYAALLSGDKMVAATAQTILDVLGAEQLKSMGYDASSAMKLMSSYNKRLDQYGIQSRADALANNTFQPVRGSYQSELRQSPSSMGAVRAGSALTQAQQRTTEANVVRAENSAVNRVWENPTQGMAQTVNGRTITPMPGNLTAVSMAEQQRNNFKANATATTGRVTYAVAGMQAREGMTNEQTLDEIKKGLTKEARAKADFYEKLSKALGLKMTIHDVMVGTNGFIDENGMMHVVLSGKQSVLRVAAHELTHFMKENAAGHYAEMRDFLIAEVGEDRFDRMVKQKAREYGIDLSTEKGKTIADDEVCAELCERMLSDTDAIERFAEKNTSAARTLKEHLLKILNAIKAALKDAKNRDFGDSWSDMINGQETIEKWITGLDAAIENAEKNAQVRQTTREQTVSKAKADELYQSADDIRTEESKKAAEQSAQKKTYVPGFKAAEVERVLDAGVFGDKSNYEGDDYEQARGMIAQLIPDIVSVLKGDADPVDVQNKVNTVVGMMLDNYFEDEGDMAALREAIPSVIGVDSTAKTDLKAQDQSLFQMSAKLSKALGHQVTLVSEQNAKGQKNTKYTSAEKLEEVWERVRDKFGLSDDQDFSIDTTKLLDFIEKRADTRRNAREVFGSSLQDEIDAVTGNIIDAVADMYSEKTGKRFSLDTDYMRLAEKQKAGTLTKEDESKLRKMVDDAAKAAGYVLSTFHGTSEYFNTFNMGIEGIHLGNESVAKHVANIRYNNRSKQTTYEWKDLRGRIKEVGTDAREEILKKAWNDANDYTDANIEPYNGSVKDDAAVVRYVDRVEKELGRKHGYSLYLNTFDRQVGERVVPLYAKINSPLVVNGDLGYWTPFAIAKTILDMASGKTSIESTSGRMVNITGSEVKLTKEQERALHDIEQLSSMRSTEEKFSAAWNELGNVLESIGYDGIQYKNEFEGDKNSYSYIALRPSDVKSAELVTKDDDGNIIPLSERFNQQRDDIRYSLDTDELRETFTHIDTSALDEGLESLRNVTPGKGLWALKDISRFLDSVSGGDKELRDNLTKIFETPHRKALKNYATGVSEMQKKVLEIGAKAGVCDDKGHHFDKKKSAAIQNIGEGFCNKATDVTVRVVDADAVRVTATDKETGKSLGTKDYTFRELRGAYGHEVADQLWSDAFDAAQKEGRHVDVEREVNTQPYTLADLKEAYPQDWQKLKTAADEFRTMYDNYIRDINNMLETIYPNASKYATVDKITEAIEKKQERLTRHKVAVEHEIADLTKRLEETEKSLANKQATGAAAVRLSELRSELASVEKAIVSEQKTKQEAERLSGLYDDLHKTESEMLSKKRTDTKEYAKLTDKANRLYERITQIEETANDRLSKKADTLRKRIEKQEAETEKRLRREKENIEMRISESAAEIKEYEANVKDELAVMGEEKALMQNAEREGDSLSRMHRLEYRSDYFHHFTEMTSGIQNLKSIFTGNTDISPAVVGKSDTTKPKSRWAGFFQQRKGGDYTADALNGMLRYGQLAEYKMAFDPFAAYLRDVEKQVASLDNNETNRDNLIRYIQQWTNTILGKSHTIDRALVDSGVGMRSKLFKAMSWINSRVIQNTLLWNMRSALIQISNVTNAKGIVTNNLDWANGLRKWALARRGNSEMQAIMNQSTFLASRYMDSLQLTDSVFKSAKEFAGWLLGALDEVSAKATWWAAYTQYQRNPNAKVIQNAYRTYDNAIEYADDVTRRTHAGRGVGELAPAMTSRVINLIAPFQVEVNNTYQLLKDNVKQKNYLGLLSTGLSIFALNTIFEAIVGSTPLGFDFIRAIVDIAFGIAGDDPEDDDDDYDVKRAAQRIAGEFVGGLPYANQIVGLIGKDNAEKIIGSDTDVTRYGNTQIGLNAMMNTIAGISDIGSAVTEGKNLFTETNFISDIDDLLNIIMPMGAKQMTRTAEGLLTMAKGYGGKVDKEGNEKVQFVADNDLVNWLHAGLFGKWSLTQASEYFDEERLLPKLFGAYEGPRSATGKLVDAEEYKAALETGIDGKQFFSLKYDLKDYTTQGGKRAEMMQQSFTPEQKAKLDALMLGSKDAEMKAEGAVVYQKSGDEWKVKADYTNQDMFDLSQAGDKTYTGTLEAMEKTGLPQDQAVLVSNMWDQAKKADDSKTEFRNMLRDNKNLTVAQKEALDLQYCGNKYAADYSDPELYELSITNRTTYEKAKQAKANGIPVKNYVSLLDKKNEYSGEDKADYMRREIMSSSLTAQQKELLDDLLVSDQGRNPDYSSQAWFDISMLGGGQYQEAKEGEKVGLKPETYLTIYNKWKTLDAKDENGKTVNGLKKKRAKEYLDSLTISAPVYDYIWTVVFGYKK